MKKNYLEFNANIKMLEKYINKRKLLLLVAVSSTVVLFAGCQSEHKTSNNTNTENNQVIDSKTTENDSTDAITPIIYQYGGPLRLPMLLLPLTLHDTSFF